MTTKIFLLASKWFKHQAGLLPQYSTHEENAWGLTSNLTSCLFRGQRLSAEYRKTVESSVLGYESVSLVECFLTFGRKLVFKGGWVTFDWVPHRMKLKVVDSFETSRRTKKATQHCILYE